MLQLNLETKTMEQKKDQPAGWSFSSFCGIT